MRYMGSKSRIAKYIIPIMQAHRKEDMTWVEPFVGGANVIDKVGGKRIGADNNKYLIALFKELQKGYKPPIGISKEEALKVKENKDKYPDYYVGWVGFTALCYRGMFMNGYSGKEYKEGASKSRNYMIECSNNILKQLNNTKGVNFVYSDYKDLYIPSNSLIYCDPPYKNSTGYITGNFNHDEFWEWCRNKAREGYKIFISEYVAPSDFKCVWSKEIKCGLGHRENSKSIDRTEKLFTYEC